MLTICGLWRSISCTVTNHTGFQGNTCLYCLPIPSVGCIGFLCLAVRNTLWYSFVKVYPLGLNPCKDPVGFVQNALVSQISQVGNISWFLQDVSRDAEKPELLSCESSFMHSSDLKCRCEITLNNCLMLLLFKALRWVLTHYYLFRFD